MGDTLYVFKTGMLLATMLSAPTLIAVVVLGVAVSLVQAAFQMQDQTLPMLVKLFATVVILGMTWAWMSSAMVEFSNGVFERIANVSTKR